MSPGGSPEIIAIVGPTATGKTALSVSLAQWLGGEVISADSRQIYREMTIGTAKPTVAEQGGVPHWLLDVASPDDIYSAARYRHEAGLALADVMARQRLPIVVGGTGFYLRALLQGGFIPECPPDPAFRASLAAEDDAALYARLHTLDPRRAADLHPNNRVRVLRALEIIHHSGAPTPDPQAVARADGLAENPVENPKTLWLGLIWADRDRHRALMDARMEAMIAHGWLDETAQVLARYGPNAHALTATHGYPELVRVIQGHDTLAAALASIRVQTHQYARRQRTWFARNEAIHWIARDGLSADDVLARACEIVARHGVTPR